MKNIKGLKNLKNKICLVYVDFDIKTDNKNVINDRKIRELIDTIEYLSFNGSKIVLVSNSSKVNDLEIILSTLNKLLKLNKKFDKEIVLYKDDNLDNFNNLLNLMNFGDIICLRNLENYCSDDKEKKNIIKYFLKNINYFIVENFNDTFDKNDIIFSLTKKISVFYGFSFMEKYQAFSNLHIGKKKNVAIVGGEYNQEKINFIVDLLNGRSTILLGGEVSAIFSYVYINRILNKKKSDNVKSNNRIFSLLKEYKSRIILPSDFIVSKARYKNVKLFRKNIKDIKLDDYIFDVGPETIKKYLKFINNADILLWSGLLGIVEDKKSSNSSLMMAEIFSNKAKGKAYGVVVGNRTCNFVVNNKYGEDVDYLFYDKDTFYRNVASTK